jgi:Sulfotransferase domain
MRRTSVADIVFHLGYPKTGTTTLQTSFFPHHKDIDYQGKLIPSHRYRDPELFNLIYSFQTASTLSWDGEIEIQRRIRGIASRSTRKIVLFSSENFLHPETADIGLVAERFARAFPEAKFIITLREQADMLNSFYRNHGAFGQYLFVMKELDLPLRLPLEFGEWLEYQFRTPNKNVLGTLQYDRVVDKYIGLFGREKLLIDLFEQLKSSPAVYFGELCEFLGVDPPASPWTAPNIENIGLSDDELRLAAQRIREPIDPKQDQSMLAVILPQKKEFPIETGLPEPWLSMVRERFRPGNRRLVEATRLPLADFGYVV